MKWNDLGHPSQHRKRPIPLQAEQKSLLGYVGYGTGESASDTNPRENTNA